MHRLKDSYIMRNGKPDRLLDREAVAKILGGSKPLAKGTLAVWDCTKRYDLNPQKVGRSVRYWESDILKHLERGLEKPMREK